MAQEQRGRLREPLAGLRAGVVQDEQPLTRLGEVPDLYRGAAAVASHPALQRTDQAVAAEPLEQKILLPGLRGFGAAARDVQPPDLGGGEEAVSADGLQDGVVTGGQPRLNLLQLLAGQLDAPTLDRAGRRRVGCYLL